MKYRNLQLVELELEHLVLIDVQESQDYTFTGFKDVYELDAYCKLLKDTGKAYAVMDGDKVVLVWGIVKMHNVGELWSVMSKDFKKHWRECYYWLKENLGKYNYRRIQALSDARYPEQGRFLESLGFEFEGVMRKLGPIGQDKCMYSIVEE